LPFGIHRVPGRPTPLGITPGGFPGLHCLSAFTVFPAGRVARVSQTLIEGLHCLSAFTVFPARRAGARITILILLSPLPFGIHRVPDVKLWPEAIRPLNEVSIAFRHSPRSRPAADHKGKFGGVDGLHCLSAFTAFPTECNPKVLDREQRVSIAFRHSPRSRQDWREKYEDCPHVSIAFRHSPRSRQNGRPAKQGDLVVVSIAFRHSPRSRPT